jgi:hypothetical protein
MATSVYKYRDVNPTTRFVKDEQGNDVGYQDYDVSEMPNKPEMGEPGASRYIGPGSSEKPEQEIGGGRGKQGGPTAAQLKGMKKGGKVKAPSRTSASKRADGIAVKGHTKGRYL